MTNIALFGKALDLHYHYTHNKTDVEITHDTLIRVIAGRPIRQFKVSLIDQETQSSFSADTFDNVLVLKNSKRLAVLQDGFPVFDVNLNDLETLDFERLAAKRYRVILNDGLSWCLYFGL